MATLILEQDGGRQAGILRGRVVIGRRNGNHIVIPDRAVSRIHAWIGQADGEYFIADTGSRNGTRVNDEPIQGRRALNDGDRIRIGPLGITFHSNGQLPRGVRQIDLSDRSIESGDGIFLDCACGAPLWAPWDFAGRIGQCRYCGQMVAMPKDKPAGMKSDPNADTAMGIPSPAADIAAPAGAPRPARAAAPRPSRGSLFDQAEPPKRAATTTPAIAMCGACQSPISLLEETTRCPDCGVTFHAECWVENRGCSSYGCKQVGVLEPKSPAGGSPDEDLEAAPLPQSDPEGRLLALDYLLLGGAMVSAVLGLLSFGIPSILFGCAIAGAQVRGRSTDGRKIITAALLVLLLASASGIMLSWYWWIE